MVCLIIMIRCVTALDAQVHRAGATSPHRRATHFGCVAQFTALRSLIFCRQMHLRWCGWCRWL